VAFINDMEHQQKESGHELVSLKTLSEHLDADRTTVRRWLNEGGVRPYALGRGRNGGVRYRWTEVKAWLDARRLTD